MRGLVMRLLPRRFADHCRHGDGGLANSTRPLRLIANVRLAFDQFEIRIDRVIFGYRVLGRRKARDRSSDFGVSSLRAPTPSRRYASINIHSTMTFWRIIGHRNA